MVSLVSTAVWFIAMAAIGGGIGFLAQLAEGRSAEIARRLEGVPVVVSAIPVAGMVLLAVARIYTVRERNLRVGERIWFWGAFAFAMVPPLALGNRRLLLPVAIVALLSLAATGWRRRVSVLTVLIILAGALIVAAIPFVRSAGSRATSPDLVGALAAYFGTNGLEDTARSFFVSYDTEMFSYIALVGPQLGGAIEWGMGRGSLGEAALQFLPASVAPWPTWSNQILTQVYGGGCGTVACPVPSIAGVLFFDTGLIGVVIGMFLFGLVIQRFEGAFQVAVGPRLVALLALGGFMPGIIRGNSVSQLWITLNVIVIALLLLAAAAGARRLRGGLLSRNRRVKPTRVAASAVNSWAGR
ncbi:hypothetical protein [Microbacterium plantarum]|uniref:Oligosaccharide repeat unit polymerase n=1 Tax=Microbacterium plantarum TaxID=1816425 RepID=A0ABV5EVW2_9MICO